MGARAARACGRGETIARAADDCVYTRAEIERYQERDPIKLFLANLKEQKLIDEAEVAEIEKDVRERVEQSVRFADESPEPPAEDLFKNIYANPITPGANK